MKKTIVFDFDGVIHLNYKGYRDGSIYGLINRKLLEYIEKIMEDYYIVISSNRPAEQIVEYMNNYCNGKHIAPLKFEVFHKSNENLYWNKENIVGVTNEKAIGILYVDDRALRYDPTKDTYENITLIQNRINELKSGDKNE